MTSQAFIKIPAEIRQPNEPHPQDCKFGQLPNEILQKIVNNKNLTVFDHACLMLTCKKFANFISSHLGNLTPKLRIESGREKTMIEDLRFEDLENCDSDSDYSRSRHNEIRELRWRTLISNVEEFFDRLDHGWNQRDTMRFCFECGKFQSIVKEYWMAKGRKYEWSLIGSVARKWRAMLDCNCSCHPRRFVNAWVKYGEMKNSKSKEEGGAVAEASKSQKAIRHVSCPNCMLNSCDRCNWWGEECCGCPTCRCCEGW